MIERDWDGIAAYCKPENKVSLGFVEGLNSKIRVIQNTCGSRSSLACYRRSELPQNHPLDSLKSPNFRQRRNLILLRAGDSSLHRTFFRGSPSARTWDMHISYYGSAGEPVVVRGEEVSWSADGGRSKFNGLFSCIEKLPSLLDNYQYIAIPDDDLICSKDDWNVAFSLADKYQLGACQLSLVPRSYYSHDITLRRPGLLLRYVTMVEAMAPIIRTDVLRRLLPVMALTDNFWGIDDVLADLLIDKPKSVAILDAVSVVHTRAVMSGPMYDIIINQGRTPWEAREAFMQRHGFHSHDRKLLGAVGANGRERSDTGQIEQPLRLPDLLQRYRKKRKIYSIARSELAIFNMRCQFDRIEKLLFPKS